MTLKGFRHFFFGVMLIPMPSKEWLNLKYSKLPPNKVQMKEQLVIEVKSSASPIFYTFKNSQIIENLEVMGQVSILKKIAKNKDDSYFQVGLIYEGGYRPNSFMKMFLPEWMKILLKVGKDKGLSEIHFYGVRVPESKKASDFKIRDLKLKFLTSAKMNLDGTFKLSVSIKNKEKVLGLWIRADGDDSKAEFTTTINSIRLKTKD